MPKLMSALTLLAILLTAFLSANIAPDFDMGTPDFYEGKNVYVKGFGKYPDTQFYLVTLRDALVFSRVTQDSILIRYRGKQSVFISWAPFLNEFEEGESYARNSFEFNRFRDTLPFLYGFWAAGKEHFSYRIRFNEDYGYYEGSSERKTLVFEINRTGDKYSHIQKFLAEPDAKTFAEVKKKREERQRKEETARELRKMIHTNEGNPGLLIWVFNVYNPRFTYDQIRNHYLNWREERERTIELYRRIPRTRKHWHLINAYYKTLGAYSNRILLSESYEHISLAMRERYGTYLLFFLFAAALTMLIEFLMLLMLFYPVTGVKPKEKITRLIPAFFLGSAFTIFVLWWVLPTLLNTHFKIVMGGEIFAFLVEALVYWGWVRIKLKNALFLSFACNSASYIVGLWLFMMVRVII